MLDSFWESQAVSLWPMPEIIVATMEQLERAFANCLGSIAQLWRAKAKGHRTWWGNPGEF